MLDRLRKLQAELERALNSRSMAIVSAKDKTPTPPHIVVKWVDYKQFGLGYILNDGSVGCILRTIPVGDGTTSGRAPASVPCSSTRRNGISNEKRIPAMPTGTRSYP